MTQMGILRQMEMAERTRARLFLTARTKKTAGISHVTFPFIRILPK
jgi:hypothetical protein